jgi:thiosulfate/3-mercaptopyruvate sulfurtransferase
LALRARSWWTLAIPISSRRSAAAPGHLPGAINHFWQGDLAKVNFATVWKPRDELRASYVAQGITADKSIIAYCNGGLESSHVYFALHDVLGYPRVRVYDGSFTEWSERVELPVKMGEEP